MKMKRGEATEGGISGEGAEGRVPRSLVERLAGRGTPISQYDGGQKHGWAWMQARAEVKEISSWQIFFTL